MWEVDMNADTSGPAFPCRDDALTYAGMTLRDYFAAKAMGAMLTANPPKDYDGPFSDYAEDAYAMADAMLKARQS
jgi:hypothetical protein